MPDTDSLREKALAATPGPWVAEAPYRAGVRMYPFPQVPVWGFTIWAGQRTITLTSAEAEADTSDAAHIAAWHPTIALAALGVIEAAEALPKCPWCAATSSSDYAQERAHMPSCPLTAWREAK